MFEKILNKFKKTEPQTIRVFINARIRPMDRGELYADPLINKLEELGLGEVVEEGSNLSDEGEIESCELHIEVHSLSEETVSVIKDVLESGLGVPKGSKLIIESTQEEIEIGRASGLALYLNGSDLSEEIYESCDSNVVFEEIDKLISEIGFIHSYWDGPSETALYLYGISFEELNKKIENFISTYPLCQKCRVVQIA